MVYTTELFGTPTKRIMDPVHGSIPVYSHEQLVIDSPLFQRLKHILQNDVVFMVFPGAKHNRFLHSIGTMHMASKLFTQITSNILEHLKVQKLTEDQARSIQYIHCCLRLAALLHDVGHFPFSHQFEECEAVEPFLNPSSLSNLWNTIPVEEWKNIYEIKKDTKVSHEDYSVRIAYEIFSDPKILSAVDFQKRDILFFLENAKNDPSESLIARCQSIISALVASGTKNLDEITVIKSFLHFLKSFISGEVDADKMDYILRDSYFSGCRYGMYNKDHLINSFRLGFEFFFENGRIFDVEFSLAILEKGLGALEDFVYARYQLYLELYNHKTVSGFRKLLSLAIEEILSKEESEGLIRSKMELGNFKNFTDTFFWEQFRTYAEANEDSACNRLLKREKLIYVEKKEDENEEDIELYCKRYHRQIGKKIDYWKSKVKFTQISPSFKSIKVLAKNDNGMQLKKVSTVTDFFTKFQRKEIYHLFEIPFELRKPDSLSPET